MSPYPITNAHTPLKGIDGSLVNMDGSGVGGIPFTNTRIPDGPHTLAPAGSNIQGAAGIYPCAQNGGKINRKKINKISRKYKMSGSRRTVRRHVRRMKSRVRSRYARRSAAQSQRRHKSVRRGRGKGIARRMGKGRARRVGRGMSLGMFGGGFQPPMTAPNYPHGHSQYQNNNGSLSNTYSTGGQLAPSLSALANPVPYQNVAGDVDNLNHNTLNSYGNIGAGSGFASRGWF
jgi:hypothetical protein